MTRKQRRISGIGFIVAAGVVGAIPPEWYWLWAAVTLPVAVIAASVFGVKLYIESEE